MKKHFDDFLPESEAFFPGLLWKILDSALFGKKYFVTGSSFKSANSHFIPPKRWKIQRPGNGLADPCPGEGKIHAAKRGAGFSVADRELNSACAEGRILLSYPSYLQIAGVA
jgi:hypothetical protein